MSDTLSDPLPDQDRLTAYVDVWWQAVDDLTTFLEELPEEAWALPTDLAGWDVAAVAAHVAHLEAMQAGRPHDDVDVGDAPHASGTMGTFTEQGVVARRDRTPDELISEIRACATIRHTELLAEEPSDGSAAAPGVFGAIGWTVERLLRNRPLDVWMHEQDIRRATGRPGNLDGPAAVHTVDYLAESLGFVLAKRVAASPGTTVVLAVAGHPTYAATVGEDGRGRLLPDVPEEPDARLEMDRETFVLLAGGRHRPPEGAVSLSGDLALGARVVERLAVTP